MCPRDSLIRCSGSGHRQQPHVHPAGRTEPACEVYPRTRACICAGGACPTCLCSCRSLSVTRCASAVLYSGPVDPPGRREGQGRAEGGASTVHQPANATWRPSEATRTCARIHCQQKRLEEHCMGLLCVHPHRCPHVLPLKARPAPLAPPRYHPPPGPWHHPPPPLSVLACRPGIELPIHAAQGLLTPWPARRLLRPLQPLHLAYNMPQRVVSSARGIACSSKCNRQGRTSRISCVRVVAVNTCLPQQGSNAAAGRLGALVVGLVGWPQSCMRKD